jgi:hypothetical protein
MRSMNTVTLLLAAIATSAITTVAVSHAAAMPRLGTDYAAPIEDHWADAQPLSYVRLNGRAAFEKEREEDREPCDYHGYGSSPCWCHFGLPNSCSAEDYAESVQLFGPPRFFVTVW